MARITKFALPILLALAASYATAQPKNPPQNKKSLVYVTESGKKYHVKNCRLKHGSKGITLEEAKKKGYKPCEVCKPPK